MKAPRVLTPRWSNYDMKLLASSYKITFVHTEKGYQKFKVHNGYCVKQLSAALAATNSYSVLVQRNYVPKLHGHVLLRTVIHYPRDRSAK